MLKYIFSLDKYGRGVCYSLKMSLNKPRKDLFLALGFGAFHGHLAPWLWAVVRQNVMVEESSSPPDG